VAADVVKIIKEKPWIDILKNEEDSIYILQLFPSYL
jgi:hypothetical protein